MSSDRIGSETMNNPQNCNVTSSSLMLPLPSRSLSLPPSRHCCPGREQKDGVTPDIVTYNTCVTIAGQAGRLDEALELLRKASEEGGLELDVVSYRAALGGLRREKRWEAAVKLLGDMRRRGLGPDEVKC